MRHGGDVARVASVPGDSGVDQLVEIIKVLGTPSKEQIMHMNPGYTEFTFPQLKPHSWSKVFSKNVDPLALELISKIIVYVPEERFDCMTVCAHEYFDELRDEATTLPDGSPLPPLFDFSEDELESLSEELKQSSSRARVEEALIFIFCRLNSHLYQHHIERSYNST